MTLGDEEWIDALAGRTPPSTADGREGAALRSLLLARPADATPASAEVDAERETALLERARREGLLPAAPATRTSRAPVWRSRRALAAAAAVVVAIGIVAGWPGRTPVETVRGVDNGGVRIIAADPAALKQELIAELHAAGVEVSGYEKLGSVGLDADLPQPLPPAVKAVLDRHRIPVPADGVLAVEIRAAERP